MRRIISRTPVRISFFGGGTDYPAYYERHRGATLGTSINQYTYVSLNALNPFFDYHLRLSYSQIELVKQLEEIRHPSVKACLSHLGLFPPLDIHISSDLPAKTGLGSSSSFTVGFLKALHAMHGKDVDALQLAQEACFIEQQVIQENVGSQDQFLTALGGFNLLEFSSGEIQARPLLCSREKKELFEQSLLIFYTGITRFASQVVREQVEKTKERENDAYLQRMYEMVFEAEEIFLKAPLKESMFLLGNLLDQSWQLKKRLSSQVSNPTIDALYEKGMQAGAFGGKLCGAGRGGFLVFLVPAEKHSSIRCALSSLLEVSFRLEEKGSTVIYSEGAV